MFRQVFLCVWKRRSRPRARETGGRRASPLARPPGPATGLTAGTPPFLEAVQRGCSAGDGLSGMMPRSWHHRLAGCEGKRSDSLSRSLTGRRLPNDALSRACANYGCNAHGRRCRARGPSGPRQARAIGTAEPARRAAAVKTASAKQERPPQEPQQARAVHVGDRGGGASRRPVSGCSCGARRDRGPAGPKETQGPGDARAAGKAPLIMAAARKRGARQYASAIVTRRAETLQGLGGAGRRRDPWHSQGRGAGREVERGPGRRSGDVTPFMACHAD
jgi:hypothetical protein